MKFILSIIVLIVTLVIVSDNMISFQQSKEDFKTIMPLKVKTIFL